jgi:hypothetical protein
MLVVIGAILILVVMLPNINLASVFAKLKRNGVKKAKI